MNDIQLKEFEALKKDMLELKSTIKNFLNADKKLNKSLSEIDNKVEELNNRVGKLEELHKGEK